MGIELGKLGIWRHYSGVDAHFAAEAEKLGYGAIWLGGSPGGDLAYVDDLLAATDHLVIATGIVNIWQDEPADIARVYERIAGKYPDRFLLGVGAGHREATKEYKKPYTALVDYLDGLATLKLGGDGSDALKRAEAEARISSPPPYDPKANVLFFVNFGPGPTKYAAGQYAELLMFNQHPTRLRSAPFPPRRSREARDLGRLGVLTSPSRGKPGFPRVPPRWDAQQKG